MDLQLSNKAVLITGGSKGIGLACAVAFLGEGARVALVSRTQANLDDARTALAAQGHQVAVIAADLTQAADAERAVAEAEAAIGPLDVLVNSAGAARQRLAEELDSAGWHAGMDAKYFPYVHTMDAVLKRWRDRAQPPADGVARYGSQPTLGAIVNIIGSGGKNPSSNHLSGGAANAALMLASVGLANHYAKLGIRINAINPGPVLTSRVDQILEVEAQRRGIAKEEALEQGQSRLPIGRYADPREVADLAVFLASARASYLIGAVIPMDGGAAASI